jgi:hypothetical protein
MAGNELQVLSTGDHELDSGEVPVSGVRGDGEGMDSEVGHYYLDPCRVMAAISLMTAEHAKHIRRLQRKYLRRPEAEFVEAVSEYLVESLGVERIEARYHLMEAGEIPWPMPYA